MAISQRFRNGGLRLRHLSVPVPEAGKVPGEPTKGEARMDARS